MTKTAKAQSAERRARRVQRELFIPSFQSSPAESGFRLMPQHSILPFFHSSILPSFHSSNFPFTHSRKPHRFCKPGRFHNNLTFFQSFIAESSNCHILPPDSYRGSILPLFHSSILPLSNYQIVELSHFSLLPLFHFSNPKKLITNDICCY